MNFDSILPDGGPWVLGHVLKFPDGITAVPIELKGDGWWSVMIVASSNRLYATGEKVWVSPGDIEQAERIEVQP